MLRAAYGRRSYLCYRSILSEIKKHFFFKCLFLKSQGARGRVCLPLLGRRRPLHRFSRAALAAPASGEQRELGPEGVARSLHPLRSLSCIMRVYFVTHVHPVYAKDYALETTSPVSCLPPIRGAKNCMCANLATPKPRGQVKNVWKRGFGVSTGFLCFYSVM